VNKQRAMREACSVVSALIESYFLVGQPEEECDANRNGWTEAAAPKLRAALEKIQDEMDRRGLTEEDE